MVRRLSWQARSAKNGLIGACRQKMRALDREAPQMPPQLLLGIRHRAAQSMRKLAF